MTMSPWTILLVHNAYRYGGGEDTAFEAERALLEAAGHRVVVYRRDNRELGEPSPWEQFRLAIRAIWAEDSVRDLRRLIQKDRPEIVHFHNTFPLVSPAAYIVARAGGAAVIQTLHNYRLLCPNALFYRDGHVCEDCLGKTVAWPGILHACYQGSRPATTVAAATVAVHRALRTWTERVDVYIALCKFARAKFVAGGLPATKIVVKPNFVHPDPGAGNGSGRYALFAGRLSAEKGVGLLLDAWNRLGGTVPLKIVGDGPMAPILQDAARRLPGLEWVGPQSRAVVFSLMKQAAFVIVPSVVFESFPLAIVESFSTGRPAIVAGHGASAELVEPGRTGLHVRPGDAGDLATKVAWAWSHRNEMLQMGREGRRVFAQRFTAEQNYRRLSAIYRLALRRTHA